MISKRKRSWWPFRIFAIGDNRCMKDFKDELAWLDNKQQVMQDLLVKLCDQNSGTFNLDGLAKVQQILIDSYAKLGGNTQILECDQYEQVDSQGNLVQQPLGNAIQISQRPDARKQVFLCIHMDTVYPIDHPFQKCGPESNGTVNGPGVADAKGGLVVMLYALLCLEQANFSDKLGWEVVINPDEEIGSPGTTSLFKERAKHFDFGMLFEPSYPDGTLVGQRKGSGNFHFVIRGKSAHAGREFDKGRNALVAASKLALMISELNGQQPSVTFNIGKIEGGDALNRVPDLAIVRVNVRVENSEQVSWVEKSLDKIVAQIDSLDDEIHCEKHGVFSSPPKVLCDKTKQFQSVIENCGKLLGVPIEWVKTGGASDGNKLAAAGLPNIDTLGVVGGNIHSPDEYVNVESLVPRAKLAASILLNYAADEFSID